MEKEATPVTLWLGVIVFLAATSNSCLNAFTLKCYDIFRMG